MNETIDFIRQRRFLIGTFCAGFLLTTTTAALLQAAYINGSGLDVLLLSLLGVGSSITISFGIAMSTSYSRALRDPRQAAILRGSSTTTSMTIGYLTMLRGAASLLHVIVVSARAPSASTACGDARGSDTRIASA